MLSLACAARPAEVDYGGVCEATCEACAEMEAGPDAGGFAETCTSTCTTAAECPAGWTCGAPAITDVAAQADVCWCSPTPVACDGLDHDCNGHPNDEPGLDAACQQKASGLVCDNGTCVCAAGHQQCGGCVDTSLDPNNCGACGTVCPSSPVTSAVCQQSRCREFLPSSLGGVLTMLAADENNLFLASTEAGVVQEPLNGGAPVTLASPRGLPVSLTADATEVYWATFAIGGIYSVPIAGGPVVELAADQTPSFGLAADDTNVYWTAGFNDGAAPVGQVLMVPKNSPGQVSVLAANQADPWGIAGDGTSVYWTNTAAGTVMEVPVTGGVAITLAANQAAPAALTVDSGDLYWVAAGSSSSGGVPVAGTGSVVKLPLSGGSPVTLATGQTAPRWGLALAGHDVYWLTDEVLPLGNSSPNPTGALNRVDIGGGAVTTLGTSGANTLSLALSGGLAFMSTVQPSGAFTLEVVPAPY
jgi:hypothetical protein